MCGCAVNRQTEGLSGLDVRSSDTASKISGPRRINCRTEAMAPSSPEFDYSPPLRRLDNTRGFRCDQCLKVDGRQEKCFNNLSFDQGGIYSDHRLSGKKYRPLRHRPDFTSEAEIAQITEKFR